MKLQHDVLMKCWLAISFLSNVYNYIETFRKYTLIAGNRNDLLTLRKNVNIFQWEMNFCFKYFSLFPQGIQCPFEKNTWKSLGVCLGYVLGCLNSK